MRAQPSTADGIRAVDFAARRHLQYILFDAGWYGDQWASEAYAGRPIPDLDLETVIGYGAERDVGVFLYVNRVALENQLETILPIYKQWGVRGIKPGFVQVGPQDRTRFLRELVKAAARNELLVNIHDSYRPDGFSRTYPNLLTQEGVRGNEHMPGARHNTILPFTRFIIGPADYTISYGNARNGTSFAHQLALAVVFYSPLQVLFWTDDPMGHINDPAVEFWDNTPTTWDDTRVIDGRIGEYVSIARRSGSEWFVGVITNDQRRSLDLPLDFLEPGREYAATVYRDDLASNAPRVPVIIDHLTVDAGTTLGVELVAAGGEGIWIRPKVTED